MKMASAPSSISIIGTAPSASLRLNTQAWNTALAPFLTLATGSDAMAL